jgi:hypothetical protein
VTKNAHSNSENNIHNIITWSTTIRETSKVVSKDSQIALLFKEEKVLEKKEKNEEWFGCVLSTNLKVTNRGN